MKKFLAVAGAALLPLATFATDPVTISDLGVDDYVTASQTTIEGVLNAVLPIAFGIAVVYIGWRIYKRFVK